MRKVLVALGLLAAMTVLSTTSAQQPDPAMMKVYFAVFRVVGDNPGAYVANPSVQKELKLDEDQIKAVKEKIPSMGFGGRGKDLTPEQTERLTKMREKAEALKDVPEDKMEEKVREAFKDEIETSNKEVEKILKPEQMTRLKQIVRQQGGPGAYLKPENVKDLKITDEQKTKLKEINTELQKDLGELRRGGGMGPPSAEMREKMTALSKEAGEKAEGVLTSEQKTKWKELIGEPFTVQRGGGRPPKKDN